MTLARWTTLLSTVALAAAKVQWDAATSTLPDAGPFGYGVMPRPTAAPAYTNAHALRKRANSDQLCGYISSVSLPEFEITCASSFSCTRHSSLSVLGCCYGQDYCAFDTTCLDSTACNSACMQSTGSLTLVCASSARPYCASYAGANSLSILICASASTSGLQPFLIQTPTLLSSTSTTTSDSDSTKPEPTGTQAPAGGLISTPSLTSSNNPNGGGGNTNVGAIAGGVAGGAAVIALGLLGFFLIRRRSKKNDTAAATTTQQQQQHQPGVGYYPTDKTGAQQQAPAQMYAGYSPQQPQYAAHDQYASHDQYAPPQQHMQPQQPPPIEMAAYEQQR